VQLERAYQMKGVVHRKEAAGACRAHRMLSALEVLQALTVPPTRPPELSSAGSRNSVH